MRHSPETTRSVHRVRSSRPYRRFTGKWGLAKVTMPSRRLNGRRCGPTRPWVLVESHSWSFPKAGFPNNCRITNSVPACEPAAGYRPTQWAENQKQRCAPRADNEADLRIDPTWGFSESGRHGRALLTATYQQ